MPLLSISIKFENGVNIRPFGLVTVDDSWNLMKVYDYLSKGLLNTGDNFVLDAKYRDYPVNVCVSDTSSGVTQSCPMVSCVHEIREFGKFITFKVEAVETVGLSQVGLPNAFDVLRQSGRRNVWPQMYQIPRPNAKHKFKIKHFTFKMSWDSRNIIKEKKNSLEWFFSMDFSRKFIREPILYHYLAVFSTLGTIFTKTVH